MVFDISMKTAISWHSIYLVSILIFVIQPALAMDDNKLLDDDTVCAAVMPCNPDGSVQAPFDSGNCAPLYQRQCLTQKANELAEQVEQCINASDRRVQRYRRAIRALRRELRSARRR